MGSTRVSETTALGAAYLAGLAVGYWKDQREIAKQWQQDRRFLPALKPAARQHLAAGWKKALARARHWADD
jgi:glycerol kinase